MENVRPSLFVRDDTFFGICQGLGEDLGFNPDWLRLALAGILFWNPVAALGGYAAAGVLVLATRLLFPAPRLPRAIEPPAEDAASKSAAGANDTAPEPAALAA